MPYSVKYLEDSGIVSVVSKGEMGYPDYKQQTEEAILLSRQYNTGLYFNDIRQARNVAKLSDIIRINALYSSMGQSRGTRLALLTDKDQEDYNLIKIFELSCTIQGWNVHCFLDRDQAFRWLCA